MRYLILTWFCIRILVASIFWILPLIMGVLLIPFDTNRARGTLIPCDKGIAAWMYGTRYRTISGICGEYKIEGRLGYTLIANMINYLATTLGDEPYHCERTFKYER